MLIRRGVMILIILATAGWAVADTVTVEQRGDLLINGDTGATERGVIYLGGDPQAPEGLGGELVLMGEGADFDTRFDNRFTLHNNDRELTLGTHINAPARVRMLNWQDRLSLELDGFLTFLPYDDQATTPPMANGFYARSDALGATHLFAVDHDHNHTQLNSHADPRAVAPAAQTSFADPQVALPWSFHHANAVLGRGEVVDMAKLVAWAEGQMQRELGEEAGRLRYGYELPERERLTPEEHERLAREQTRQSWAATHPWRELKLGPQGEIPDEAFEWVDETRPEPRQVKVAVARVDAQLQRVVSEAREQTIVEQVPTGRRVKQLKAEYRLLGGKLMTREPAGADAGDRQAALPDWIQRRLP